MNRIDQLFQTHKDHVLSIYFCALMSHNGM